MKWEDSGLSVYAYIAYCRKESIKIDFSGTDLGNTVMSYIYLIDADFTKARLVDTDLRYARMSGACLAKANLTSADLSWANLSGANLAGANLTCANLTGVNLAGANLAGANLTRVDLHLADGPFSIGYFGRHNAVAAGGYVCIGCNRHTYDFWLEYGRRIGRKYGYTEEQIEDYRAWLKIAIARQKRIEQK